MGCEKSWMRSVGCAVVGFSLLMGGCASDGGTAGGKGGDSGVGASAQAGGPSDGPSGVATLEAEVVQVRLLVIGVDGTRFRNSADSRWLQSFLTNEARDVDIALSTTDDLLGEAKRRLRSAPGVEFVREPMITLRTGSRGEATTSMGTGTAFSISARPRLVDDGLYEVGVRLEFTHDQASGDGNWNGVSFRAPALKYGTTPLTVPNGEARAVRMRREIGQSIRPTDLQIFVFAEVTRAE